MTRPKKKSFSYWLSYLFPDRMEKDSGFREYITRLTRSGMIIAGTLGVAAPVIHLGAMSLIVGQKLVWISRPGVENVAAVADKIAIFLLGVVGIVLSRFCRRPRGGRIVVFLLILAICLAILFDDIVRRNVTLSAGYLILALLIGMGAAPFRPWQITALGGTIMLKFYLAARYIPGMFGEAPIYAQNESYVLLSLAVVLCTVLSSLIYHSRYRLYRSRQKQISLKQSLKEHAEELEETNIKLRQTQAQLVQKEKMVSLGNLVAGLAHEVNTPLGAINSNADTAQRIIKILSSIIEDKEEGPWTEEKKEKLNRVVEALNELNQSTAIGASRIDKVVKALRGFAQLDATEYQKADIHQGIEDTLTLLIFNPELKLEIEKDFSPLPEIYCNPGQLNQVFLNILTNAIEATDRQGLIRIKTRRENENVVIQIEDNGRGISGEDLDKIFDPGYTTKGRGVGTGLGLSICYRIVSEHGGSIEVDSEKGKGSTFTISIPLRTSDVQS
jgi:signal transduction histidine kinase